MSLHVVKSICILGLFGLMFLVGSCSRQSGAATEGATGAGVDAAGATSTGKGSPTRPLRDVLSSTLASLGVEAREAELSAAELRDNTGLLPGDSADAESDAGSETEEGTAGNRPVETMALDPELVETREGLIGMVIGSPKMLPVAKKDIAALKDEISPVMAAGFAVEGREPDELRALIELAVESPSPAIAVEIATVAATHPEAWLRRYAAWALASLATTEGADRVVPLLLRRLKYERDPEALVWASSTLSAFENYAGTELLYNTTTLPVGDAAGDAARAQLGLVLQRAATALGLAEIPDTKTVIAAWNQGSLGRDRSAISDGLLGEVWMLIADLSGEHFQLRGVDDARYALSHLGPWAAVEFALALEDDDEYVRLHTAQVLERMGPRGQSAFDSLVEGLRDPHDAVCGAAAETLVAVTRRTEFASSARTALLDRIAGNCPYEVKVACVRALGHMDPADLPAEELRAIFDSTPLSDLRLAAAPGLLRAGAEGSVLPWLVDELQASVGDPAGAESVLGQWLEQADTDAARASLAAWREQAAPMSVVHTGSQAKARRAARAAVIRETLLPTFQ